MFNDVNYLHNFINDLPIGIARQDTSGELPQYFNAFFQSMFGWSSEDISSMDEWFEKAYPDPAYRKEILALWDFVQKDTRAKNKPYSEPVEIKVCCKDGNFKWCEARYYEKENFIYGTFIDITNRKETREKLQKLSTIDPLTGIYNRRYFNLTFYDRWNIAQRQNTSISLVICDIDNFKDVNDSNGHLVGDKVLKAIAQTIQKSLKRTTDFVARYGGEEFVIVSCGGDNTSSISLCQFIQDNINKAEIEGIEKITLSYGIYSIFPSLDFSPEEFINNADKALYEAKTSGRNKIVVYS